MANQPYVYDPKFRDPINDLNDGLNNPLQNKEQSPPGFFSTLRNPIELILEDSLPASLYQWITGNTKKRQAEKALRFLEKYPELQNSGAYKEATRIYNKFGYLLEEGNQTFDAKEIVKLAKNYPSVFGAELVNMLVADPYLLLLPTTAFAGVGRGIVNATRLKYQNKFKVLSEVQKTAMKKGAYRDIKAGAMTSVLLPFAFSTGLQLGEKGEIDANRTTAETTFGATAGLLISTVIGSISALTSRNTYINQIKVNESINKSLRKYKDPSEALEIVNENPRLINDVFDDLKLNIEDYTPSKIEAIKATITGSTRELLDNANDSIKSSLVKAGTFGTIGATAQFLTEEDEKVKESIIGFGAGVAVYGILKGLKKALKLDEKVSRLTLDYDNFTDASLIQSQKILSNVGELRTAQKNLLPDRTARRKVFHNIQGTKVNENFFPDPKGKIIQDSQLTKQELEFKKINQQYYNTFFDTLTQLQDDLDFNINFRNNYTSLIFENPVTGTTLDFSKKIFGSGTKTSRFFFKRKYNDINEALAAGARLVPDMDDPIRIMEAYAQAAVKALANRNLVKYLTTKRFSVGTTLTGTTISYSVMYDNLGSIPEFFSKLGVYKEFRHPLLNNNKTYYVHQDIKNALNMRFEVANENQFIGATFFTNLMMKRLAVGFSFFHGGALIESMIQAGLPAKVLKEIVLPSKNQILQMINNPNMMVKNFVYAKQAAEQLGLKDVVSLARASRLEIAIPEDVGFDKFYVGIRRTQDMLKNHLGIKNADNIEKVFKWFDTITWDKLFTQAKLYVFLKQLDKLVKPGDTQAVIYAKAKNAATFSNDAFGGLNWEGITREIDNKFFRNLATTLFKPSSRGYLQLLLFAPDWTISNIRIMAKALPGITKDPDLIRLYQYYFARGALIFATLGTALNYMFTGHSTLENKDPTRIDLGDGTVLTLSKQFMEPFQWVTSPQDTAIKKIGSLPKGIIEVLTNKQYLTTKWSPNITTLDDNAIEKFYKIGGQIGSKFLPIWVQTSARQISEELQKNGLSADLAVNVAVDFVLGQTGHPRYKGPRSTQYKLAGLVRSPYETLF